MPNYPFSVILQIFPSQASFLSLNILTFSSLPAPTDKARYTVGVP